MLSTVKISIVTQNTLKLDPDPQFLAQFGFGSKDMISIQYLSVKLVLEKQNLKNPMLRILNRMDPELLPGSGSGIRVPEPDPAKSERSYV